MHTMIIFIWITPQLTFSHCENQHDVTAYFILGGTEIHTLYCQSTVKYSNQFNKTQLKCWHALIADVAISKRHQWRDKI